MMYRLLSLPVIVFLLFSCQPRPDGLSQKHRTPNHIDSLKNNRQVEEFVNSQIIGQDTFVLMPPYLFCIDLSVFRDFATKNHIYDSFSMPSMNLDRLYTMEYVKDTSMAGVMRPLLRSDLSENIRSMAEDARRFCDSIKTPMVAKEDFDNNGTTDLVVSGQIGHDEAKLCILDKGKNVYQVINLDRVRSEAIFPVPYSNINDGLIFYKGPNSRRAREYQWLLEADTMVYYDTFFVEKKPLHKPYDINEVSYLETPGWSACCEWSVSVGQNGNATYKSRSREFIRAAGKRSGGFITMVDSFFVGKVDTTAMCHFIDQLNVSAFPTLRDSYRGSGYDDITGYLEIAYDHGKVKKIQDYRSHGTFSLCKIYETIRAIKLNTRWQFNHADTLAPLKE